MKSAAHIDKLNMMSGSHSIATWLGLQATYNRKSISELSRRLQVSRQTIYNWARHQGTPSVHHLKIMARYWCIDTSQILLAEPKMQKWSNKISQTHHTTSKPKDYYRQRQVKPKKPLFSVKKF